ncbi:MAG TPA: SbcC/MukB-like Walker B domain-containing protein [Solirubrobacteraceae bacterium]
MDGEQAAHRAWLDLREQRLAGMAAELAAGLRPGEPCSVCGATEHPAPAHAAPDPGTPAALANDADITATLSLDAHPPAPSTLAEREQAAQRAHEHATQQRQAAEQALAQLDTALAAARAVAGEDPADALVAGAARLDGELAAIRTTAAGAAEAQQALATLAERIEEHERAREQAARDEAVARATHAERSAALAADRARIEEARGSASSIADRAQALRAEAETAEQEAAAREAGFPDAQEARAALLDDDATAALAQRIEDFDRGLAERRALTEQLARELAAADEPTGPAETAAHASATDAAAHAGPAETAAHARATADAEHADATESTPALAPLDALADRATAAIEADEHATRRHALADQRLTALRRLAADLDTALDDLQPVAERTRTVKELAGLVDGSAASNRLRMRLSAYVLAARLEEVAQAATVRLERMSDGRYQLIHTDDLRRGTGRSGLELRVVDGWTGCERSPSTLSGGETFLASLALALGLADVVAAEAGGSRLETLFVDEGFGSLDERTLDEVLDVLDGLREGGRTVGIVSHVAELRQRIPARLRVIKSRDGSRVEHEQAALAA